MERTCFRFVLIFLPSLLTSFVFIIEISYILSYLMLQDKCLCCSVIYYTQHESRIWELSMRHLLWTFLEESNTTWTARAIRWGREKSTKIFTCFSSSHACHNFPIGSTTSSCRSLQLSTQNVMNENVFYVILHNIIVFNKQISLSLHLIVKRRSQNLSARSQTVDTIESRIICLL